MHKLKLILFAVAFTVIQTTLIAQNNTNSPYSRYGYGNLADKSFASQRGMGGIGYGLRNSKIINPMNPASFSNVDSMTFMADLGLMGQMAWFEEGEYKDKRNNGNLEYLAIQFPLIKNMGVGLGLEPVSYVGYNYGETEELKGGDYATHIYRGRGGLSQVYGALSYEFFDRLSLGVKFSYLFGDLHYQNTTSMSSSSNYSTLYQDTLRTNGFLYNIGLQYIQPIGTNKNLIFGAVYTPKIKTNSKFSKGVIRYNNQTGSEESNDHTVYRDSVFEMPQTIGIGITYNQLNKLTLGADVLFQQWSDAKFYDATDNLNDRIKYSVGVEYIPNFVDQSYFRRIRYRAGAYYSNSYLKIKDSDAKEYGFSLGLGLPLNDRRSFINLAFEYSMLRPDIDMIKEDYLRLTISYTFNELWFIKRKLQ